MGFFNTVVAFAQANPWLVAAASALFSTLIHALSTKAPRLVAGIQAVSFDFPKLWAAITDTLPPAAAKPLPYEMPELKLVPPPANEGDK